MTKKHINESYDSNILKKFIAYAKDYAKKNNKYYEIHFVWQNQSFDMINVKYDGTLLKGTYRPALSDLSDDNIVSGNFYKTEDLFRVLKGQKAQWNTMKSMTVGKKFSFIVLVDWEEVKRNKNTEVIAAMIIEPNGTKQIYDAIHKGLERRDAKKVEAQFIDGNSKEDKAAIWKDVYKSIRKAYDKFKADNGDKAALELSDSVKKLVNNQDCINTMNKLFDMRLDKETATKYLYAFLLDIKTGWRYNPLEKDERFVRLYRKFHSEHS